MPSQSKYILQSPFLLKLHSTRKIFSQLILALLTLTTCVVIANPATAGDDKPSIYIPSELIPSNKVESGNGVAVFFDDSLSAFATAPYLADKDAMDRDAATGAKQNPSQKPAFYCASLQDQPCANALNYMVFAILQPCKSTEDTFCIDDVYANTPQGRVSGNFLENLPSTTASDYVGDKSLGLPSGGPPTIWQIPGVKNASGTDTYTVTVSSRGGGTRSSIKVPPNFTFLEWSAVIYATPLKSGSFTEANGWGSGGDTGLGGCATTSKTKCAVRDSFIMNGTSFGISLRFPKAPASWFFGRLTKQKTTITKSSNGSGIILDISGEPTLVPLVYGKTSWKSLPDDLQKFYGGRNFPFVGKMLGVSDPNDWNVTHFASSGAFSLLKSWLPLINDSAAALTTQWFVKASPFGTGPECKSIDNSVVGLVSSNATAYVPGPPVFNKETQTLEYQVGAPHLTPSGNVFRGTYDLAIQGEYARCIYGFAKNAPVKATVSIVTENGQEIAADEQVGETDGWFYLRASNFTFSSPKLRVKLSQVGASSATSNDVSKQTNSKSANNPSNTSNSASKKSASGLKGFVIKCANSKGKVIVTQGLVVKCPSGYKLVSKIARK